MPFFGNSSTGQTRRRIFTHGGSNDADSRKDVPFWGLFSHCSPFRGWNPPNPHFGAWIGVFNPNSQNRKTCILSKLLHRFHPTFAQWQRPPNDLRGWCRHTHNKSKMAGGRYLGKIKKSPYLGRGLTDFDEIWHSDVVRPSWPFRPSKNLKFQKSKMVAATVLKNPKSWYLDDGLTNRHEIWHGNAIRHLWCLLQLELLKICNFKNRTWRPPPFWKIEKSPYVDRSFSDFNEIWHCDAVWPSWPFGRLQIWDLKKSNMVSAGILTI